MILLASSLIVSSAVVSLILGLSARRRRHDRRSISG